METFLVRVWHPGEDDGAGEGAELKGVVEHVGSRTSAPFKGTEELIVLLQGRTRSDTPSPFAPIEP